MIDVPGHVLLIHRVEDGERVPHRLLHEHSVATHSFGTQRWCEKFVGKTEEVIFGVTNEDGAVVLDAPKGVAGVDELGEVLRLTVDVAGDLGTVGQVHGFPHVRCLDDWSIFLKQSSVVAQMIGVHFIEVADQG